MTGTAPENTPQTVQHGLFARASRLHLDAPVTIVAVAFLLRVLLILLLGTYHLPHDASFAFEVGAVAGSVAEGHGFSSPFGDPTGPTAIVSPIYAYLLAGIFKVFGVYTDASALAAMILDALCSALTCWVIFILARETFDRRVAVLAAWLWAFSPPAVHTSTSYIWETCLSTLLVSLAFLLTVRLPSATRIGEWVRYGALWAVAALTNGAVLAVFPCLLLWSWLRSKDPAAPGILGRVLAAGLACGICLSPWAIRNAVTFGSPMLRSGIGAEIYGGMHLEEELRASDEHWPHLHNPVEQKLYRESGEMKYMAMRGHEAMQLVAAHPWDFLRLSFKRAPLFWLGDWYRFVIVHFRGKSVVLNLIVFGSIAVLGLSGLFLAWRKRATYASFYTIPLMIYPVLYYVTHIEARYRHPMEPLLIVLAAYAMVTVAGSAQEPRKTGAAAPIIS